MSMAMPSSATAQLESLYPKWATNTRICIVGAGASGLSAAYALVKLGYENVTVLEKNACVAGMCETVEIEGFLYDLGGQLFAKDSAPTIMSLAAEMGVEMEDVTTHKLAMIDCKSKSYEGLNIAKDYISIMPLTLQLQSQAEKSGRIGMHAVSDMAYDISSAYIEKATVDEEGPCKLKRVPPSVATGYTASGYGFVDDMPYAYMHEFTRTSMLGKIRRFKAGYASLWKSIADRLPHVQCNCEVIGIKRDSEKGTITIQTSVDTPGQSSEEKTRREYEFDKVIISGTSHFQAFSRVYRSPLRATSSNCGNVLEPWMSLSRKEEDIFSKVRTIDYYTTVLKITGLDLPQGFYYCKEYTENPSTIGHPVAMQRFHAETNVYLFWSYGNSAIQRDKISELLYEDIQAMGGQVEEVVLQRKWTYFPHVCSEDMKAGFYNKLEELQGKNNTFYVGGLMAFELTERNASYSVNLIAKHFATASENMKYVKKLFELPLLIEGKPYSIEDPSELQGLERFPDLPYLDAYLQFWARHPVMGIRTLYTWLSDDGKESDTLTYTELDNYASTMARHILLSIKPGERVILIHPTGLQFIIAFFACVRARVLPVPLIPPDPMQRPGQVLAKIQKVAEITQSKALLTTSAYHSAVNLGVFRNSFSRKGPCPSWPNLPWIHTDAWVAKKKVDGKGLLTRVFFKKEICIPFKESGSDCSKPPLSPSSPSKLLLCTSPPQLRESDGSMKNHKQAGSTASKTDLLFPGVEREFEPPKPEDVCFLQFTSGSTGDPKGVMITHGGLIHNVKLMRSSYKSTSETVLVSWLPQYHDMGLIGGLLTAMVSGGTAILFSPMAFIKRPMLWLDAISKYKATHSAAPNFAFELVIRRYEKEESSGKRPTLDLSSLQFIMISAEPIRKRTVKRFVEMLQASGLREQAIAPGYGLAENCVFVSCAWGAQQPIMTDCQGRICCGYVDQNKENVDICIVRQETCEEIPEGEEGEVWVSSPSSGIGYWGQPEQSMETFKNKLKSCSSTHSQRHYIKTGDLGRVIQGKLFITGRIKDLIIVQGRNVYPTDIEKTVEDCCTLLRPGCCAVFGAPQDTLELMGIPSAYSSDGVGIVVIAEVRDGCVIDTEVFECIKAAVAEEHGVELACVTLIKPRSICKTTSGKIRRFECLKQFSDGKLQVVADSFFSRSCPPSPCASISTSCKQPIRKSFSFNSFASSFSNTSGSMSPCNLSPSSKPISPNFASLTQRKSKEEIQSFLTNLVAEKTGMPPGKISPSDSLTTYGLNSTGVVWAAQKLSDFLGINVAAIDIYTAESIFELSNTAFALLNSKACMQKVHGDAQRALTQQESQTRQPGHQEIEEFLVSLIAEKTGIPKGSINVVQPLASYGVNSVEVVSAAQKLSTFLGAHVAAIDIYTCSCISELVEFSESLIKRAFKNKGNTSRKNSSPSLVKSLVDPVEDLEMEILANGDVKSSLRPSSTRRILITTLQMMGILYSAIILLLPAVGMSFMVIKLASINTLAGLPVAVSLLPLASIAYIMIVGVAICLFAVPFLQPNYAQNPCLLLWTVGFVKWWTLYRLQDFATTTIACSLRGTIFMTWWYRALGAQVGKDVILDTTDISEPALLRIGNGAIIAEGACIQAHEVSQGLVRFRPLLVGGKAWMGPYSLATMGAHVPSQAILPSLQVAKKDSPYNTQKQIISHQPETAMVSPFFLACWQILGLYLVFLVSAASAAAAYPTFLWLSTRIFQLTSDSILHVFLLEFEAAHLFLPIAATLPWHIAVLTPLLASMDNLDLLFQAMVELITNGKASALLVCSVGTYITYGILLCTITCALKWCLIGKLPPREHEVSLSSSLGFRLWLVHRLITSAHMKFTMFLSGTEALCMYLRSMGSKIEYMVSIRNVNPVINPDLLHLGRRCHLGDFAKIITSMPNRNCNIDSSQVSIGAHSVVGAQSVVLPGATLENQVLLGAMSVAAKNSTLKEGGIYVGVQNTKMINQQPSNQQSTQNITHQQNLEPSYRKLVATLAAHIATTTAKVQTRYFHRLGVAGRGTMTVLGCLPKGFPPHDIFGPGKVFQVIIRHSNSLSSDDDARGDARGAAMRILASQNKEDVEDTLVDLTMKSGKAFYARTLADFMTWLMGSREQRGEHVKKYPHMAAAVWMSLRRPNSYAVLRYYTNTCCLLRASDRHQKDHYVRFCLRPADPHFDEGEGSVQPEDILPPDTGMVPRDPSDHRPPLFLADDFRKRLLSDDGVRYVLQIQLQPVSHDAEEREVALDCTRPWDETLYPFQDVALIHLNEVLDSQLQEDLRFDPMNKTRSLDMIHATSQSESASLEHGRCLAYVVAQYLRNGLPLKEEWRHMLGEIDLGKQLLQHYRPHNRMQEGGCPALSGAAVCRDDPNKQELSTSKSQIEKSRHDGSIHGENNESRSWGHDIISNHNKITTTKDQAIQEELVQIEEKESSEFMKLALTRGMQPLLQTVVPVVFLMLAMYPCLLLLSYVGTRAGKEAMVAMIPAAYVMSGLLMSILSILSRWVLIGNTKPGDTSELWGFKSLCDTTWQAVHALLCTCFLELTKGSLFCIMYFNCLGASISMEGVYMDTLYALNPNLLQVGPGCCIGKNALLFGHLYEGGRVTFKKIALGEGSHVGTRALLLPGLKMEPGAHLEPLGLGMKDEIIGAF